MRQKLYQYAVLFHETTTADGKQTSTTKVIVPPKDLLSPNDQAALLIIARQIPEEYIGEGKDSSGIEILLRPF